MGCNRERNVIGGRVESEQLTEVTSASATEIYVGTFRVYPHQDTWAIDRGDASTIAMYPEVYVNCPIAARIGSAEPRLWFEGYGVISVAGDGAAFIYAHR